MSIYIKLNVEPKKGQVISTQWRVEQATPDINIDGRAPYFEWRTDGQVFVGYKQERAGLVGSYYCSLLRADFDLSKAEDNRRDHAGYDGNAGAFCLRGESLGEICLTIGNGYASIKVNNYCNPTPGQRDWIEKNIVEALKAHIEENKAILRKDTFERTKARIIKNLVEAREALDKLETEAQAAIEATEKGI